MKTIWYLINIPERKLLETYEGQGGDAPEEAKEEAERVAKASGSTCVLARGRLFFQK